jgi:formate hydrogenlyase transcriptional activator
LINFFGTPFVLRHVKLKTQSNMNAISSIHINEPAHANKQIAGHANLHLKELSKPIYNFSNIIGSAPAIQKVYHMVSLVAESNSTVLLLGETGTGKGLIADAIHNSSPRKNKQIIKVNCAALPTNLIESELFGHEKGSFTGAIERRIGKFELANNSTLFLDEIGEMALDTQVKLLHALQDREITRVGGKAPTKVDVRIVAATNRNLEKEVKAGRFRSDLYYRLNVFPIHMPPLRERREDIASLANFFLSRYSNYTGRKVMGISLRVINELKNYSWPGNVRELEHLIERSVLLSSENELREIHLPAHTNEDNNDRPDLSNRTLHQIERTHIVMTLKKCNGKISGNGGAAALLEIPSTTLHSKIKKLRISKADYFLEHV